MGFFGKKENTKVEPQNQTLPQSPTVEKSEKPSKMTRKQKSNELKRLRDKEKRTREEIKQYDKDYNPNDEIDLPEWEGQPKSTARNIRYNAMYENGICEISEGIYSVSVEFSDISYQIASQDEQERIFAKYCDLLNYFLPTMCFQITARNIIRDVEDFRKKIAIPPKEDNLQEYRTEITQNIIDKAGHGDNRMDHAKYVTVTFMAQDMKSAIQAAERIQSDLRTRFKALRCDSRVLSGVERCEVLHSYFNDTPFSLQYRDLLASGMTTRDYIAPDYLDFSENNYFEYRTGGKPRYGQTLYCKKLPADLGDRLLHFLSEVECDMTINLFFRSVAQEKALDLVKGQRAKMDLQKTQHEQKNVQSMGHPGSPPFELQYAMDEADELLADLQKRNQRLFRATILIYTSANTEEELYSNVSKIIAAARQSGVDFGYLEEQQEAAINSVLPLGACYIDIERNLTTAASAIFVPFTTTELLDTNGLYYGQNAISHNLIMVDRAALKNGNAVILGVSGGGKSFKGKEEVTQVLVKYPKDEVIIIDPESEYVNVAEIMGGEVIEISAASTNHLNPFDMDVEYGDGENPLHLKGEFILSLCEAVLEEITPIRRSILARCVRLAYDPYFKKIKQQEKNLPTLNSFVEILKEQPEPEAALLATELELYSDEEGMLNVFAHHTNVNLNNRFVVFDTRRLGSQLKTLGMLVVMDQIWNRVIANHRRGVRTWVYIDEMQVFFQNQLSTDFFANIWARFRKRYAYATGLTQNVERILMNDTARFILSNSEFVIMLDQARSDREALAEMLDISDEQLNYITNADQGNGLLRVGGAIVPFRDKFPTHTKLYKAMTTKPTDFFEEFGEKEQEKTVSAERTETDGEASDASVSVVAPSSVAPAPVERNEKPSPDKRLFYGHNGLNNECILVDRNDRSLLYTGHAVIIGNSGMGKKTIVKKEIEQILEMYPDDEVIVIDPKAAFVDSAKQSSGQIISMASGNFYINPLDMDEEYVSEKMVFQRQNKTIFLKAMFEILLGELEEAKIIILERCVQNLYEQHADEGFPTLTHLINLLYKEPDKDAHLMAAILESRGMSNFIHSTNIISKSRFKVYDTSEIECQYSEVGMLIAYEHIWNHVVENYNRGVRTWLYIDQTEMFFNFERSSEYFAVRKAEQRVKNVNGTELFESARKVLKDQNATFICQNCDFQIVLQQDHSDVEALAKFLLEPGESNQLKYIENAEWGCGLIKFGRRGEYKGFVPFQASEKAATLVNLFPEVAPSPAAQAPVIDLFPEVAPSPVAPAQEVELFPDLSPVSAAFEAKVAALQATTPEKNEDVLVLDVEKEYPQQGKPIQPWDKYVYKPPENIGNPNQP